MTDAPARDVVALIEAYLATPYRVRWPDGERVIGVGQALEPARAAFAVISACNPRSQRRSAAENHAAHLELGAELAALGVSALPAANGDPGSDWFEESWCVLDPPWPALDALARWHGQNAVLACAAGGVPRLRCYRPEWRAALAGSGVDTRSIDWIA